MSLHYASFSRPSERPPSIGRFYSSLQAHHVRNTVIDYEVKIVPKLRLAMVG